jgi:hypothetical protein
VVFVVPICSIFEGTNVRWIPQFSELLKLIVLESKYGPGRYDIDFLKRRMLRIRLRDHVFEQVAIVDAQINIGHSHQVPEIPRPDKPGTVCNIIKRSSSANRAHKQQCSALLAPQRKGKLAN